MRNIALAIEWNWCRVKWWRWLMRTTGKRRSGWEGALSDASSRRMERARCRALELQHIYNSIYFNYP